MKLQDKYLTDRGVKRRAYFLGELQVACLALFTSSHIQAAPLDYEIGNSSVRSCKLVYSDGRPDEQLSSCEGTKEFACAGQPFVVKMVLTNEINQDVNLKQYLYHLPLAKEVGVGVGVEAVKS